jgi:hypothetical protein
VNKAKTRNFEKINELLRKKKRNSMLSVQNMKTKNWSGIDTCAVIRFAFTGADEKQHGVSYSDSYFDEA